MHVSPLKVMVDYPVSPKIAGEALARRFLKISLQLRERAEAVERGRAIFFVFSRAGGFPLDDCTNCA
jgi:hypothetical protein